MNKKYKLIKEDTKQSWEGSTLYRIQALVNIGSVLAGTLGGYIEKESNLSQDGNAWVSGDAQVFGNAQVFGDARVSGYAQVFGNAQVCGDARVSGYAQVFGDAWVFGNAWVSGDARVEKRKECYVFHCESYAITVTPQNVSIGCQLKTHKEWLKVTKKQAIEMGLDGNLYKTYADLVKIGIKAVTRKEKS